MIQHIEKVGQEQILIKLGIKEHTQEGSFFRETVQQNTYD